MEIITSSVVERFQKGKGHRHTTPFNPPSPIFSSSHHFLLHVDEILHIFSSFSLFWCFCPLILQVPSISPKFHLPVPSSLSLQKIYCKGDNLHSYLLYLHKRFLCVWVMTADVISKIKLHRCLFFIFFTKKQFLNSVNE